MQIIRTDLSAAARAGALDASLAFNTLHNEQRELLSQTAISGLQGLQSILSSTGLYGSAISSLQEATESIDLANAEAQKDPIKAGTATQRQQVENAVNAGRQAQVNRLYGDIDAARTAAGNALNGTAANTAERTAANQVKDAADAVRAANQAFYNGSTSQVQSAYNSAVSARNAAQSAYNSAPDNRKAAALAVLNAANQTVAAAQQVVDLKNTPTGRLTGITPEVTDLGNGYQLSTWGSTGLVTLTSPDGSGGIIIQNDGSVDKLDETGKGWKFDTTSTFVISGETKVTVNPGTPANILVSRGIHAYEVSNLQPGQAAATTAYDELNGREADRASNDGHIIRPRASDSSAWELNGQLLGDAGSREVVATTAVTNELKLDPTDITVSPDLLAFINGLGLTSTDYDGDGKLNNEELAQLSTYIATYVQQLQEAYNQALANISQANGALFELNEMLDALRRENENKLDEQSAESAESRALLQAIERRLVSALQLLRGTETAGPNGAPPPPVPGGIEASAERVLNQLNAVTQGGVQALITSQPPATPPPASPAPGSSPQPAEPPQGQAAPDPLGDSLRRASRLLSGLSSNLNILDLPPAAGSSAPAATPQLPAALGDLATALVGLAGSPGLDASGLEGGLQSLFAALGQAGVLDLSALPMGGSLPDLLGSLGQLLGGLPPQATAPEDLTSLSGFLNSLAGLGGSAPGGSSSNSTEVQLQLVLAGLAALGSAGADQSTGTQGSTAPTPPELRLGLQSLLAALSVPGLFPPQAGQPPLGSLGAAGSFTSGNTQPIATISGNFYTDPELLKQIEANLNRALQVQNEQLSRASTLFTQSQEIVQKFVSLIKEDNLVRELVQSDDLSDDQQQVFDDKMTELRKDWGMEWGSDDNRAPASQSSLVSRAVQSGMMV